MISVQEKVQLLVRLGEYMLGDDENWLLAQDRATSANAWFTPESIQLAVKNIVAQFLQHDLLENWIAAYPSPKNVRKVGIVMAGNIPLVGFHDFLCGFVSGHDIYIKLSSKDDILLRTLVGKLFEWQPELKGHVHIAENLKGCEAYIATGSNNTARYFEEG